MAGRNTVEIILSAADHASGTIRSAFGTLESSSSKAMGVLKAGAATAVTAIAALSAYIAKTGVEYDAMMEQSQIAWGTILGSQEEAKKTLKELQTMGAKTPYEFEGLDKSAKLLEMAGFQGKNLFNTLTKVGDAVSAVGGNDEVLQGVSMALYQMSAKGKISAQEMNQMAERGIPAWQMLADGMHKSVPELMKMSEQGKLFAKDAIPMMVNAMGNEFGGSMEKQSHTFNGMISTMKDDIKILSGELAKPIFDKLKQGLQVVLPMLDGLTSLAKGDMKGFSDTMKNAFGGEVGGAITSFVSNLGNGFALVEQYVDKAKQAVSGIFDIATGNEGTGVSILANLGFSVDAVSQIEGVINGIRNTISGFINGVKALFSGNNSLGESFGKIFNTVKSIVMPILTDIVSFVKDKFAMIKQFWDENGAQIVQAIKNFWAVIAAIFQFIAPVITFILKMLWDTIAGIIDGALKVIMGLIKIFAGLFTGDFGKMWEGIKEVFFGAIEFLWNWINLMMFGRILSGIKTFITGAGEFFAELGPKIWGVMKNLDTTVMDIVKGMVDSVLGFFQRLADGGAQIFGTLRYYGESIFTSLWGSIKAVAGFIYDSVMGSFRGMYDGAVGIFNSILSTARTIFNFVKDAITNPIDTAKTLVGKAIGAIKDLFSNLGVSIPLPHLNVDWAHVNIMGHDISYPDGANIKWYDSPRIESTEKTKKNAQLSFELFKFLKTIGKPVILI